MHESTSPRARLLVVDDDEAKRYVLARAFRDAGFEVSEAATGAEALRLAPAADVLVLDVRLPDGSGFDVCRQLKADPATARTPVLLTSAIFTDPDSQVQGLDSGADVYLSSGTEPTVLAATARALLRARRADGALRASEERLRGVFESATDYAILTLDPSRAVTGWSPGAAAILGYGEREILGRSGDIIFTPEDRAAGRPAEETEQAQREGRAEDERWHVRKNGTRFWASGVMTPLGEGGANGFVKVLRDLTDRKRMEDELLAAREELERRVAERTAELAAALEALEAEMARRADLARRLTSVQEDERQRVARDLHDTVGQTLTALSLAIAGVAMAGPLSEEAAERLSQVQRLAADLGRELHEVAMRLRPTSLDDLGLEAAVRAMAEEWARRTGVTVEFQASGMGRFLPEAETALYRVVQEALTNVAKHAGASRVSVVLGRHDGEVVAVVEDDGAGFDLGAVRAPSPGRRGRLGLVMMRERLALLGGAVEVESEPGGGTTVIARVPLPAR